MSRSSTLIQMKPTWLIHNYAQDEFDQIKAALETTNTPYQEVKYQSIMDNIDVSALPSAESCVVLYGSIQFVKAIAKLNVYTPGAYGFSNKTDCANYYPKIPQKLLLNYPYAITTWAELKRSKEHFKKMFFNTALFVRPNSGNKVFPGQSIYHDQWDQTIKLIEDTSSVNDETFILVSNPKNIKSDEYRFVIVDKKVITGSKYNWAKECSLVYPENARELAQTIADQDWQLDSAYTCDIAITPVGPKVIELNSFSMAGLYASDRVLIVEAINETAMRDYNEIYEDIT